MSSSQQTTDNVVSHPNQNQSQPAAVVTRVMHERQNRHRGNIIWLTGLSASGKTTIAHELENRLFMKGCRTVILDGDNLRNGLCADLGFSREDREENIRRVGEVARLFMETGTMAISAFISPYAADRDRIRVNVPEGDFIEIYIKCSIEECERRDPKGLYKKARSGLLKGFTGIDDPFEPPVSPELVIDTEELNVDEAVDIILDYLHDHGHLPHDMSQGLKNPGHAMWLRRGSP